LHERSRLGAVLGARVDRAHQVALVGLVGGQAQHLFSHSVEREASEPRIPHDEQDRDLLEDSLKQLAMPQERRFVLRSLGDVGRMASEKIQQAQ